MDEHPKEINPLIKYLILMLVILCTALILVEIYINICNEAQTGFLLIKMVG
jgi:hypothetical protein